MFPDEFTQRVRARLDDMEVPDQAWGPVSRQLNRRRRRRISVIAGSSAALAVAVVTIGLTAVLPGRVTGPLAVKAHGAGTPALGTPTRNPAPPRRAPHRITAAMAAAPGFLMYVGGHNLLGPILSSTTISGGNSAWPATSNSATITASPSGETYWSPSVNPSRTEFVYVKGSAAQIGRFAGEGDLVIANVSGFRQRTVTTADTDADPVWSPDGHEIAFLRSGSVWLMSSDGTHQHALGIAPQVDAQAHTISWSPGNKELAVGIGNSPVRIGLINIPQRSFKWFTPAGNIEQYDPAWSPDGKQLVYGQTGPNALFISNLNGRHVRQLTTCKPPRCTQDTEPAWSPDESEIAFVRSVYGVQQIEVIAVTGGKVHAITRGPDQHNLPSW